MFGCLARVLGFGLVVLALGGLWLYRDRVADELGALAHGRRSVEAVGTPDADGAASAAKKLGRVAGADSTVLDANEAASWLLSGLAPELRRQLRDVDVRLGAGRVRLDAQVRTARLPRELLGPATILLHDEEPVMLGGALRVRTRGTAEWTVDEATVRSLPLPADLVPVLVRRALGDAARTSIPIPLPAGVRDVRVSPGGLVFYGVPRT